MPDFDVVFGLLDAVSHLTIKRIRIFDLLIKYTDFYSQFRFEQVRDFFGF